MAPTSAEDLGITLDPDGQPYDSRWELRGRTAETRFLTEMHFAGGQVRIMDGNAIQVDPGYFGDEATAVDFADTEVLHVSIVWERTPRDGEVFESVLGVRLDVEGSTVDRWSHFELAYGTDGGVGGVTSQAVIDWAAANPTDDEFFIEDPDFGADYELGDYDGTPGIDTLVFSNGFGDGGFPMSRGFDSSGELVSVLIWDTRYPWRLAVPGGTPPPDVTSREQELIDCMNGTRLIDQYGNCS